MEFPPEKWERVKDVLAAALEQEPEATPAFLDEVCSEGDIRREVERLLVYRSRAASLLSASALEQVAVPVLPPRLEQGKVLSSRLRIVRFIARGGVGEVYEAEASTPGCHTSEEQSPGPNRKAMILCSAFKSEQKPSCQESIAPSGGWPLDAADGAIRFALDGRRVKAHELPAPPQALSLFFRHCCEPILPNHSAHLARWVARKRILLQQGKDVAVIGKQTHFGSEHDWIVSP